MDVGLILTFVGLPAALLGGTQFFVYVWRHGRDLWEGRSGRDPYHIIRTHVKYIMWEDFSEMIKLRQIRAFRRVRELKLDRYPEAGALGAERECIVQNFYSLPGSATQRSDYFLISLEESEAFRPHRQHALVFGYTVPLPLNVTHPDDQEEGLDVRGPLGSEVTLEVHAPSTRRFGPEKDVRVLAVSSDGSERAMENVKPTIYRAFKNTDVSRSADVLRLALTLPHGTESIRVRWPWKRVVDLPNAEAYASSADRSQELPGPSP